MTIYQLQELLKYIVCPTCSSHMHTDSAENVKCDGCSKEYFYRESILNLLDETKLDAVKSNEHKKYDAGFTVEKALKSATKDDRNKYEKLVGNWTFKHLCALLNKIDADILTVLGVGTGYEIKKILDFNIKYKFILCSDISLSQLKVVPYTLKEYECNVGLFTADMEDPVLMKLTDLVFIFQALHHLPDIHEGIDKILDQEPKNLVFCEPTTNFLLKYLGRFGLTARIEWTGIKPRRISLQTVKAIAKKRGYDFYVETYWVLPVDYFEKLPPILRYEKLILFLLKILTKITAPFKFGNLSIVHLQRP